jgi:hypothetical protein
VGVSFFEILGSLFFIVSHDTHPAKMNKNNSHGALAGLFPK